MSEQAALSTYPEWFRRLRTYYASNSARMFVLHFNVDDYVLNPYDAGGLPVTRLVPLLEHYARSYADDGWGLFQTFFRYSLSLDLQEDDCADLDLQKLSTVAVGALVGGAIGAGSGMGAVPSAVAGAVGGAAIAANAQRLFKNESEYIGELSSSNKVLRVLERILRSGRQRSLVIVEHVETLAPADGASQEQLINSEILKRLATDYQFRGTNNLLVLLTRNLQSIDPGIYAPGTNCFTIQIDLPNDAERAAFLRFMARTREQERAASNGNGRMGLHGLISGLANIDPRLKEAVRRGSTQQDDPISVLAKLTQGFRLVEIDQLNRQVRAQYQLEHRSVAAPPAAAAPAPAASAAPAPAAGGAAPPWLAAGPAAGATAWPPAQPAPAPYGQPAGFVAPPVGGLFGAAARAPAQIAAPGTAPLDDQAMIDLDDIKAHKRRAIREQSGGLLEVIDVQRGFDAIGGMETVKHYLRTISRQILARASDERMRHLVPRGLILAGPPGTGKTIIAEALALESQINMVRLRNIRNMYVGESERRLNLAFEIIRALSPILVFVDEIDQAFGTRGLGQSSDGGTSERMFGQILEFIGDDRNRGDVIWVAATNRPDVIDAALLRRFDRVIPCLLPDAREQAMILEAMPKTIRTLRFDPNLEALIRARSPLITDLFGKSERFIATGAVIEAIARRSAECASQRQIAQGGDAAVELEDLRLAVADYRSNANALMYDYQSLLAIQACNFYSVMPLLPEREPFSALVAERGEPLSGADGEPIPAYWQTREIDYQALDIALRGIRQRLGAIRHQEGA